MKESLHIGYISLDARVNRYQSLVLTTYPKIDRRHNYTLSKSENIVSLNSGVDIHGQVDMSSEQRDIVFPTSGFSLEADNNYSYFLSIHPSLAMEGTDLESRSQDEKNAVADLIEDSYPRVEFERAIGASLYETGLYIGGNKIELEDDKTESNNFYSFGYRNVGEGHAGDFYTEISGLIHAPTIDATKVLDRKVADVLKNSEIFNVKNMMDATIFKNFAVTTISLINGRKI